MCKKAIPFTDDNREHALAAAKWWLNAAPEFDRQKLHRDKFRKLMEAPFLSEAELVAGQVTVAPAIVRSDVDLDREGISLLEFIAQPPGQGTDKATRSNASNPSTRRSSQPKSKAAAALGRARAAPMASAASSSSSSD